MAPLTFSQKCPCISEGNGIVNVPPDTGHIGNLVVGYGGTGNTQLTFYQPASRFLEFQSIEAGIFVALTLAALGSAVWLLHRRAS
jgi:hypothetical protein